MSRLRSDSWTLENDQLLGSLVIESVMEGKTQSDAFEKAAKELDRTVSACAFRWNAEVRKAFQADLKKAREERKKVKAAKKEDSKEVVVEAPVAETKVEVKEIPVVKKSKSVKKEKTPLVEVSAVKEQTEVTMESNDLTDDIKRIKELTAELEKKISVGSTSVGMEEIVRENHLLKEELSFYKNAFETLSQNIEANFEILNQVIQQATRKEVIQEFKNRESNVKELQKVAQ